jgi:hypothetical protein
MHYLFLFFNTGFRKQIKYDANGGTLINPIRAGEFYKELYACYPCANKFARLILPFWGAICK